MQASEQLRYELERYHALRQNHDAAFRDRVHALQAWQVRRLQYTHAALVADPEFSEATRLFLEDIYGGIDLLPMAKEIERALPIGVRVLPDSVLKTSATAIEVMVLTQELDEALATLLFETHGEKEITRENYVTAFSALGRYDDRRRQMALVRDLGHGLDRYVRSRVIFATFRIASGPAHRYGLGVLYDFLDRGFRVMRPMGSTHTLFERLTSAEEAIIQRLESGAADPFQLGDTTW